MEKTIVDFVVVCLKSNSENLRRPLTFHRRIVSKRDGFQMSKICSKIDTLSDGVCHACARKIRNAFELNNFIYSSLQKEKATEVSGDLSRCKRLLPTTASSPDRSPQTRKGHKASRENSASKKSQKFGELPPPSSTTNNITSNTLEEIQEITPSEMSLLCKICTFAVPCSVFRPFCCFTRVYEGHFMLCYKEELLVELSR